MTVPVEKPFDAMNLLDYMPKGLKKMYADRDKYPVSSGFQIAYAVDGVFPELTGTRVFSCDDMRVGNQTVKCMSIQVGFEPIFENAALGYKRIYVDLPGMGKSIAGKDIKTSDDMLDVIYHFVKDVVGHEVILAGESFGGYIVRGFVNKYQLMVKSVILLCPLVYSGYRNGQVESLCVMERDETFLQTLSAEQYNSFTYMNVVLTEPVWKLYERDILPAIEIQDRYFLDNVLEGAFSFEVDELDAPFMKPCLIIVGKQDTEVGYTMRLNYTNCDEETITEGIRRLGETIKQLGSTHNL